MTLVVTPNSGSFRGGDQLRFFGSDLDMTACQDSFSDGVIGALWSNVSTGTGVVTEHGDDQELVLDSGATAGSFAALRTVAQMLDADVQVSFRLATDTRPPRGASNIFAEVVLRLAASDSRVGLQIAATELGREAIASVRINGVAALNTRTVVATNSDLGAVSAIRLMRAGRKVALFLGGGEIFRFDWFADLAFIEIGVRNDPIVATRVAARAFSYLRLPVVKLGSNPILDLIPVGTTRAIGSAPAVSCALDAVDLSVTGCSGAPVVTPSAFTFERETDLMRFQTRGTELTICNDPTLTKRRGA